MVGIISVTALGTVYVAESERHYILESPLPLLPAADLKASCLGRIGTVSLGESVENTVILMWLNRI